VPGDSGFLVAERDLPVGAGVHRDGGARPAQPVRAEVARARRPPRANGRALKEGFDPLAGPVVVVVRREGEAHATPLARGRAATRQGAVGEIWHGWPV